jgi:hypothetical protein
VRLALLTLFAVLAPAACGGGNGEAEEPTPAAPATTADGAATSELPETPLNTTLEEGYTVREGNPEDPDPADLPVEPGAVAAHWYKSGDNWVVVYAGVPEDAYPLCPGNSILVGTDFADTSNAPVGGDEACVGANNLAQAPAGAQMCGTNIVYVTAIPSSKEGTLYSTIEVWEGEATIHGVTGVTSTNRGEAPEIELSQLGC